MLSEESFLDFTCPHCHASVSFPQTDSGHLRLCPECTEMLIVPEQGGEKGVVVPIPIATPRLKLRRFAQDDWRDLLEFLEGATEEHVLHWLETDRHMKLTTPDQPFYLGLELQENKKLIGFLSLRFTDSERLQATLDLTLNPAYGQGDFGQEAVDALLGFCFKGIKLHRLTASCSATDTGKCQLFDAVGLRREGEFVKDRWENGGWINTVAFAALDEEYAD